MCFRHLGTLILAVLVYGCSTTNGPAPVEERGTAVSGEAGEVGRIKQPAVAGGDQAWPGETGTNQHYDTAQEISANPAVVALLTEADSDIKTGNEDTAAAAVERALRLEPKDAYLWHRLAEIKLAQDNWQQAYVLATKSNSLARSNTPLQIANWEIIAQAKSRQGDRQAVVHAKEEIKKLKYQ